MIHVSFDHGALYVQFGDAKVARTVELVKDELLIDLDKGGRVLGIEALKPGVLSLTLKRLPPKYRLPAEAAGVNFKLLERSFAGAGV